MTAAILIIIALCLYAIFAVEYDEATQKEIKEMRERIKNDN